LLWCLTTSLGYTLPQPQKQCELSSVEVNNPALFPVRTASVSDHLSQSTPICSARSRGRQRQVTCRLGETKTRHKSPGQSPGRRLDQSPCDDHRGFDMKMLRQRLVTMERKLDHYHQLLHVKVWLLLHCMV